MNAIARELEQIVGPDGVCAWEKVDPGTQPQALAGITADCLVYPRSQAELATVMAYAYRQRWRVLPCGRGTKLSWGGLVPPVQIILSTERLSQLVEHAVGDLTVTVEAGLPFSQLQAALQPTGQFLALDPSYPETATLGGIIATADTGSWRHRYGSLRDMLLGINFVRSDGQVAKAGGRVVKNVAGYDLMKLFTGSFGTLGMITQATFRVYPLPEAAATVVLTGDAAALTTATKTLLASALTPTGVDLLTASLVQQLDLGRDMGLVVRFQNIEASVNQQATRLLEVGQTLGLQGKVYTQSGDTELWQNLQLLKSPRPEQIVCKFGVVSAEAVATLAQIKALLPAESTALIHVGSGLGMLCLNQPVTAEALLALRAWCQERSGFLTILAAPVALKQQLEVWGYAGNTLELMRRIKQQFDPENLLSPQRFVGGI
ncbi:FAD-binding oxidoreductase [Leptolyngbya sp. FACHB-261]|uniref:FAD-binding oxidoreductase n=1 Tax=Leptolyngbya sp. FACHB-261 TaxID=2692806 RepID=UPI001686DD62|nr:FAD-binding oxidoreductase [Leptolyngbya sp. FACHB-261]MBD2102773.1 FAD-binding oxidoreductase [Leptolyngbya sp. FACHB-261]